MSLWVLLGQGRGGEGHVCTVSAGEWTGGQAAPIFAGARNIMPASSPAKCHFGTIWVCSGEQPVISNIPFPPLLSKQNPSKFACGKNCNFFCQGIVVFCTASPCDPAENLWGETGADNRPALALAPDIAPQHVTMSRRAVHRLSSTAV